MTENGIPESASGWFEFGSEFRSATPDQQGLYLESLIDEIERLRADVRPYGGGMPSLGPPHSHWDENDQCVVNKREYEALKADADRWRALPEGDKVNQALKDQDLGALVRKIPLGANLCHIEDDDSWRVTGFAAGRITIGDTPDEALREALHPE